MKELFDRLIQEKDVFCLYLASIAQPSVCIQDVYEKERQISVLIQYFASTGSDAIADDIYLKILEDIKSVLAGEKNGLLCSRIDVREVNKR